MAKTQNLHRKDIKAQRFFYLRLCGCFFVSVTNVLHRHFDTPDFVGHSSTTLQNKQRKSARAKYTKKTFSNQSTKAQKTNKHLIVKEAEK